VSSQLLALPLLCDVSLKKIDWLGIFDKLHLRKREE
jgi:hypothetical protein